MYLPITLDEKLCRKHFKFVTSRSEILRDRAVKRGLQFSRSREENFLESITTLDFAKFSAQAVFVFIISKWRGKHGSRKKRTEYRKSRSFTLSEWPTFDWRALFFTKSRQFKLSHNFPSSVRTISTSKKHRISNTCKLFRDTYIQTFFRNKNPSAIHERTKEK